MEYVVLFLVVAAGTWIASKVVPTVARYFTAAGQEPSATILLVLTSLTIAAALVVAGMAHKHIGKNLEEAVGK